MEDNRMLKASRQPTQKENQSSIAPQASQQQQQQQQQPLSSQNGNQASIAQQGNQ